MRGRNLINMWLQYSAVEIAGWRRGACAASVLARRQGRQKRKHAAQCRRRTQRRNEPSCVSHARGLPGGAFEIASVDSLAWVLRKDRRHRFLDLIFSILACQACDALINNRVP